MSSLVALAQFVVLANGVPVALESVEASGSQCPGPSLGAVVLALRSQPLLACEGLVLEAGQITYWSLSQDRDPSGVPRWRGWRSRVPADRLPSIYARSGLRLGFPGTDLAFNFR
ncbi:MAG: hypothetical protein EBR88_02080 [Betaproteobacteria bacterium]|nr:hypothetical protein [Betaproteobacteria bacterium]